MNRYRVITKTPAKNAGVQKMQGAESAPPPDPNVSASSQASGQDPAVFAGGADSAGVQNPHPPPAKTAPGTTNEPPRNSPTESSEGGAGGPTLFGEDATTTPKKPRRPRRPRPEPHPRFAEWWAAYPLRTDKGDAEKAYAEAVAAGADPDDLLAGAIRYQSDSRVLNGYPKGPARWLHAKCWLDEERPGPSTNGSGPGKQTNYADEEYASGW